MSKEFYNIDKTMPFPIALDIHSIGVTDEQFYKLCQDNRDLRLELTANGELMIMVPTGSKTGWRNAKLIHKITDWAEKDGTGITFDSSTGFTLPNGAKRSPDVSWVINEKWESLTEEQQDELAPICPDFVVELRSSRDSLFVLQEKMQEYIDNGTKLGWLIDPKNKIIYIYRPAQPMEKLENPKTISGESVLSGFVLNLSSVW